jgi:hypothetical protein
MSDDDITRNRHGGNPRSNEALPSEQQRARDRGRIVVLLYARGAHGATCWEVSLALPMPYQTASGRLSELKRDGIVVCDSSDRNNGIRRVRLIGKRDTATGSGADVCVLPQFAPPPAEITPARPAAQGELPLTRAWFDAAKKDYD